MPQSTERDYRASTLHTSAGVEREADWKATPGIHWHIANDVRVRHAGPAAAQIPWVQVRKPDGTKVTYFDAESKLSTGRDRRSWSRGRMAVLRLPQRGRPSVPQPRRPRRRGHRQRAHRPQPAVGQGACRGHHRRRGRAARHAGGAHQEDREAILASRSKFQTKAEDQREGAQVREGDAGDPARHVRAGPQGREVHVEVVPRPFRRTTTSPGASAATTASTSTTRARRSACSARCATPARGDAWRTARARVPSVVAAGLTPPPSHNEPNFMHDHRMKHRRRAARCATASSSSGARAANFCSNPACHGRAWPGGQPERPRPRRAHRRLPQRRLRRSPRAEGGADEDEELTRQSPSRSIRSTPPGVRR